MRIKSAMYTSPGSISSSSIVSGHSKSLLAALRDYYDDDSRGSGGEDTGQVIITNSAFIPDGTQQVDLPNCTTARPHLFTAYRSSSGDDFTRSDPTHVL